MSEQKSWRASRLSSLPPYLFVEIDRKKRAAIDFGRDVIDFGIGDPDQPTFPGIVATASEAIHDSANHRYSSSIGMPELRRSIAKYMAERYEVLVDPQTEVVVLLGAKEGIGHFPTAVVDAGEVVLVPEPGYPVYESGAVLCGATCHTMPLGERNGWRPVWSDIPDEVRRRAKLMWLNYPNNPTGAVASLPFFEQAAAFAREHNILIAQDAAYNDVYFGDAPPSILQVAGAKETAVEFHSFSKTFNMTGWRLAFVVGNAEALAALALVKSNLDSGPFQAVQVAGMTALAQRNGPEAREQIEIYRRRRDLVVAGLRKAGWALEAPAATLYVWAKCPGGQDSMSVANRLLAEADVVAIPGAGFGAAGEGHMRFALTVTEERTREAMDRVQKIAWRA